jgi:hypothetical protein
MINWKQQINKINTTEKENFAEDLYHSNIPTAFLESPDLIVEIAIDKKIVEQEITQTEKIKVIESLKDFVEDNGIVLNGSKVIKFHGGEIISTSSNEFVWKIDGKLKEINDEYLSSQIPESVNSTLTQSLESNNIRIVFATDCLRQENELFKVALDNSKTMLSSIAKNVLKLESNQFIILPIVKNSIEEKFEQKWFDLFLNEIITYRPVAIIGLGAKVVNFLTGKINRLADNHGELYKIKVVNESKVFETILMPLFHPDYMEINKNTKKTAQKDLESLYQYMQNNP